MSPSPARVGRDGLLRLRFVRRNERTILASRCFRAPLHALEPLDLEGDGSAWAVLLNPAGGVLGGDHLRTEVQIEARAHVGVTTPSATKVYGTSGPPATQRTSISVAEGATLEYVPHHLIPHPGAALEQSLHVDLGPGSRLILYDGLALGRAARGERFVFRSLTSEVRVDESGRPLYWDRFRLTPEQAFGLGGLGGAEGHGYLGSVVFCHPGRSSWDDLVDAAHELLASRPDLRGGVSVAARGGCVVRFLAPSAHALTGFADEAWALGRRHLLGRPPLDLRLG